MRRRRAVCGGRNFASWTTESFPFVSSRLRPSLTFAALGLCLAATSPPLSGCSLFVDLDDLGEGGGEGARAGGSGATGRGAGTESSGGGTNASPDTATESDVDVKAPTPLPPSEGQTTWTFAIRNPGAATLFEGHTVRVDPALFAGQGFQPNLSDVRLGRDGMELDRVVEVDESGRATVLWFALPVDVQAGAMTTLSVVRSAASPPREDGRLVFPFYDDFPGTAPSAAWRVQGAPVVADGVLTLRRGQAGEGLTTPAGPDQVPAQSALEIRARVVDPASAPGTNGQQALYYWFGYQREGDFTAAKPWILWVSRGASTLTTELYTATGACSATSTECRGGALPQGTTFRTYRIERRQTRTTFFLDGEERRSADLPVGGDLSIMMRNWLVTSDVQIDWVRARALADREPDLTLTVASAAAGPSAD